MGDRELLEAAARAAGLWDHKNNCIDIPWNALTNDGDNRRLQIKLRLGLVPQEEGAWVCVTYNDEGDEVALAEDADPNRAIVRAAASLRRAAAEIGRDGGEAT